MITLVADSTPLSILEGLIETVEIIDRDGRLLGRYEPANPEECKAIYARALAMVEANYKEDHEPASREHCKTTAEVLEHMRRLEEQSLAKAPVTDPMSVPNALHCDVVKEG